MALKLRGERRRAQAPRPAVRARWRTNVRLLWKPAPSASSAC